VKRRIWVKSYRRKDGVRVKGHWRTDTGAPGRTPKSKQWFEAEISLERYNYDYDDKPETRRQAIRAWAKEHGDNNSAWMKLFHHFQGLANLTARSQPKASRAYRQDARYVDSVRERRFGSK